MFSRLPIRYSLPLVIVVMLALALALSTIDSVKRARHMIYVDGVRDAVIAAEQVALSAERSYPSARATVAADIAIESANQRIALLVLIDPDGVVQEASRLALRGRRAVDVIPGLDAERLRRVAKGKQHDVQAPPDQSMLSVMTPFTPSTVSDASVVMVGWNGSTRNTSFGAPADTAVGDGKVPLVRRSVQL